ncbi:MAG: ribosome recycling factor, partial [SAR324 cluster bacterium]|nr:ribosome recycling factor [SAR324 cluster bacterium]
RKIAIRNIRRDSNDHLKKMEKNKEISQDQEKDAHDNIQAETDKNIKAIDDLVNSKEKELLTV